MATDVELLQSYACARSERAFTELVQRHIDLVFSAALREAHGDASLAEDITQTVFVELAKKASKLIKHPALAGWLYTCMRRMAANLRRSEDRRQGREQEAQTMNDLLSSEPSEPVWRQVQPVLDNAMHELSETDRAAVVLRFFEDQSLKEVGLALGINENAARMRVDRALEKLQTLLAKRGVTSTTSGLAAAIVVGAVMSAPSGLVASVATGALAVTASTATTLAAVKLMTMTKLKLGIISALAVATVATPVAIQHQTQTKLRAENQSLREQVEQLTQLKAENERLSHQLAQSNGSHLSKDQLSELMKLRGEVGLLRRQTSELEKLRNANRQLQAALAKAGKDPAQQEQTEGLSGAEYQKQAGIAKMNYAKYWVLAFQLYAEKNGEHFPAGFEQALPFLPEEAKVEMNLAAHEFLPNTPKYGLTPDQYEIVYQGTRSSVANPASVIVIREKQAWQTASGRWARTYGFVDGHSEVHSSDDGNFEPWEKQHMISPASPSQ
ncbi:MAG: hypothetical protein DME19_20925 [Verrucomicrobia bacterium]|nr:MAG: hypothetical protein DME19_20925 [Verrucomicrobiota bacterium]